MTGLITTRWACFISDSAGLWRFWSSLNKSVGSCYRRRDSTRRYRGFHNTAIEALQVLRRIWHFRLKGIRIWGFHPCWRFGNCVTKTPILQRFRSESYIYSCSLAVKMVCYTWVPTSWSPDQSLWARRLSTNSDTRQKWVCLID